MTHVIVGLGNPGKKYEKTRHNLGFLVVDYLIQEWKAQSIAKKSLYCLWKAEQPSVILVKPQTYMNKSGECVQELLSFYKIAPENCIVIQDDLSLKTGSMRFKKAGSHAGHNGIRSVHQHIGEQYYRLKIGIDHPKNNEEDFFQDPADYVLSPLTSRQWDVLQKQFLSILQGMQFFLEGNLSLAVQTIHQKEE
jgi:PTH1 family peptidyl-tRNA hydrolase